MEGCDVLAEALKNQGVQHVFGIVGIPVVEVGNALQVAGVHYVGMRNEQAVSALWDGLMPHMSTLANITSPLGDCTSLHPP
jgi:thiamine pyrophosphate-dependent acetolactate synthase large subunit-like protein